MLLAQYPGASFEALAGDASTRRFVRMTLPGGGTRVLMDYGKPFDGVTDDVRLARLFGDAGLPVARVMDVLSEGGVLVLEDLGDRTMEATLAGLEGETAPREALYQRAVDLAADVAVRGTEILRRSERAAGPALDEAKFALEMDFFLEHFVRAFAGRREIALAFREALRVLVTRTAAHPRVLCHRDYHSRNLMVRGDGSLAMVDIQDARWGPDSYDLASLLRDAYVPIPEELVERMIDAYLERPAPPAGRIGFRERFDEVASQRMIKALGTFGYQIAVRGNPRYREAVPRTLERLERLLPSRAGTASIARFFDEHGLFTLRV